jgi:hypothetical protein
LVGPLATGKEIFVDEAKFRRVAKKAVVDYWNENKTLVDKFGEITTRKVYVTWQCKTIQNFKALLGVGFENDARYFEFSWNGDAEEGYLDVYKLQRHVVVKG